MPRSTATPLLQLLAAGFWAILARASRPNTGIEDDARREPGIHVMRLHRYDHSGLNSMMEAEAKWHRGEVTPSGASSFVQVSSRQMEALQSHHRQAQVLRQTIGHVREASTLKIGKHRRGRAYNRPLDSIGDLPPAIELDRLESQYVGPIGVGTKVFPSGCASNIEQARSLTFISYAESEGANANATALAEGITCHRQDESHIYVVLDTGSTNTWVNSDLCTRGACSKIGRNRYHRSASVTYVQPKDPVMLNITFGTGKVSGPTAIDDFHVGPYTVAKQTFGMIQEQEGRVFDEVPFEGILGLAFPRMSANGASPVFDNIIKQKVLKRNEFAFYFSLDNPSANAIFWGGADPTFYTGRLQHFKVVDPYYWSIPLVHFKIGDEVLLSADTDSSSYLEGAGVVVNRRMPKAIVDTGTTFFTAESALYSKVMDRIGTRSCNEVSKDSHPPVTFRLQNADGEPVDFVLNNMQYMTQSEDGDLCSPAFMRIDIPWQHGPAMVLGEVFLRHYFSIFNRGDSTEDNAQVSFAPAAHSNDAIQELKRMTKSQPGFFKAHKR